MRCFDLLVFARGSHAQTKTRGVGGGGGEQEKQFIVLPSRDWIF